MLTIRVEESISFECSVRFLKFFFLFMSTITVKPIPPKMMRENDEIDKNAMRMGH